MLEILKYTSENFGNFANALFFLIVIFIGLIAIVGSFKPFATNQVVTTKKESNETLN